MNDFKVGDLVVPLFEEEIKVLPVIEVDKCLVVKTEEGWEIGAFCNYRHATLEEMSNEKN